MAKMNTNAIDEIVQSGRPHALLSDGQGGRLLILEQGARALALTATEEEDSAFWYAGSVPHPDHPWNSGGDRTWVSPEMEFFVNNTGKYAIPGQLDPGGWKLASPSSSLVSASMECELLHRASGRKVFLHLEKQFALTPNPYTRNTPSASSTSLAIESVSYVGYEVHTRMKLTPADSISDQDDESASAPGFCNLWSIMQVPPGGKILVPTYGSARPLTMFSQSENLQTELLPNGFRIPCEGPHSFKQSVEALSSTGRFGYLRRLDEKRSSLVVRQFSVHPSGVYPDYPADNPQYRGSCMQFYFDGGQLGHFAELEYHSPALNVEVPGISTDASQVYYFVGPAEDVERISQDLLGLRSDE